MKSICASSGSKVTVTVKEAVFKNDIVVVTNLNEAYKLNYPETRADIVFVGQILQDAIIDDVVEITVISASCVDDTKGRVKSVQGGEVSFGYVGGGSHDYYTINHSAVVVSKSYYTIQGVMDNITTFIDTPVALSDHIATTYFSITTKNNEASTKTVKARWSLIEYY